MHEQYSLLGATHVLELLRVYSYKESSKYLKAKLTYTEVRSDR